MTDIRRTVDAVWRIESARIVATLAKMTGDVGLAEDLAQEALVDALTQWPESGVPQNAGAWLTAVAKRKAIDGWRRRERLDERYRAIAHDLSETADDEWQPIDDDVLRLVFTACHPVLSREAQVALTLRVVGGLTTEEIARLLLVPVATVQQRIVRAKKTLSAAHVPFEAPEPGEWAARLGAVLGVVYLLFTEGYAATSGDRWIRTELANEALRLGRVLAGLLPREPEVHGLVALMEFQASRFAARTAPDGTPILLADQDRSRWDRAQIARGRPRFSGRMPWVADEAATPCRRRSPSATRSRRASRRPTGSGSCCSTRRSAGSRRARWSSSTAPSPCRWRPVPANALRIVDRLASEGALRGSHLLPSVRGELLARLGRTEEARSELITAAGLAANERESAVLRAKAAAL